MRLAWAFQGTETVAGGMVVNLAAGSLVEAKSEVREAVASQQFAAVEAVRTISEVIVEDGFDQIELEKDGGSVHIER